MAQANTDYLNALEDRVQAAEQQLREAKALLQRIPRLEVFTPLREAIDALLTPSPAQPTGDTNVES